MLRGRREAATDGCAWLLQDRGYVVKAGRALRPESRGRVLSSFLQAFFPQYLDYGFTASLEDQLDEVSGLPVSCLSWEGVITQKNAPRLCGRGRKNACSMS